MKKTICIPVLFFLIILTACQPKAASIETEQPFVSISDQSSAPLQSDSEEYKLQKLEQGFSAPMEGLLDYEGIRSALVPVLEITTTELPRWIMWYRESGLYTFTMWDSEARIYWYAELQADTGELVSIERSPPSERVQDQIDTDEWFERWEKMFDEEKSIQMSVEYCEKLYEGKTVTECLSNGGGGGPWFDKDDYSYSVECWVYFDDGKQIIVNLIVPGYSFYSIRPLPENPV